MSEPRSRLRRLVVPSPDGRRVLARPNGLAGWALPVVATEPSWTWGRPEGEAAARLLGADVVPVRRLAQPDAGRADAWVVEARGRIPAAGNTWIGVDDAARLGADEDAVRAWAAEGSGVPDVGPDDLGGGADHLRPGWFDRLDAWIDGALPWPRTGPTTVIRHWEIAVVVAVPTGRGRILAKQPGPDFEREAALTAALRDLPGAPTCWGHDAWHGTGPARLLLGDAGVPGAADAAAVARTTGRLQAAVAARPGVVDRLRAARIEAVDDELPAVADRPAGLDRALDRVAALELATSIVHGDLHRGNACLADDGEVTIIDWSDPALGCPALDLDLLIGADASPDDAGTIVDAWAAGFGTEAGPIRAALAELRLVAATHSLTVIEAHGRRQPPSARAMWAAEAAWFRDRLPALAASVTGPG